MGCLGPARQAGAPVCRGSAREAWEALSTAQPRLVEAVFTRPALAPAWFAGGTPLAAHGIGAAVLAGMHRGITPGPPPWLESTGRP